MKINKGFSLLEMLVAFTILAISLSILLKIFSSGVNTAFVAEEYTSAVQIAESVMAQVGVENELQIGESTGIENEKYHWRILVTVMNNPAAESDEASMVEFFQVNVSVRWDTFVNQERSIELKTIIIGYKQ